MKRKIKILLADDDPILCRLLPRQLNAAFFEVTTTTNGQQLLDNLQETDCDVILLDVNLPDVSGLEVLQRIRQIEDAPEVIMLTADSSLETGIEAMRLGAYDYITKPAAPEQIEAIVRKAEEKRNLVRQNVRLRAAVRQQNESSISEPIFYNPLMQQVFAQAERVAKIDTTVLITGESGTGKDVLARWIHQKSERGNSPLIAVNCGALPENLFESEFFGHEKGSFTGATSQRIGLIEAADGSSLFLDEMGEMPLLTQVKLLHFLENNTFRRVGATRDRKADVRVIAATNRPLELDVREGKFRADLFYRLNVVSFHLPPLRERREDVPPLIDFFLERLRQKFDRPRLSLSEEARRELEAHEWRGNVRELKNTLERAVVLAAEDEVQTIYGIGQNNEFSNSSQSANLGDISNKLEPLAEVEKKHILRVLQEVGGKRERAAAILGITSRTLYRKLQEFNFKN